MTKTYFLLRLTKNNKEYRIKERITYRDLEKQIFILGNGNYKLRLKSNKLYELNSITGKYELVNQNNWWGTFED